jgi:signal transduction histidine kinase/ActR/RegA family two-component response regulator
VAVLVGVLQGVVIAVGWYAMYHSTHEQVASGGEEIIVQNNEQMARSIIEGVGGINAELTYGDETWNRLQNIVENVELSNGGFACIVDRRGNIVCHPEMRENPGLREINLSAHELVDSAGGSTPLMQVGEGGPGGVVSGSMDFQFDGKHYVATQALGNQGVRLIVHQPVSGLTAASRHLTSGLILQAILLGIAVVGLTMLIVFFIIRVHNASMLRWNAELDKKVQRRTTEMRDALAKAEQAAAVKAEFLANMSHEIRTPMNVVLGMVDVLGQTTLNGKQSELVRTIHESGASLLGLLGDVLEYSSGGVASATARKESFCLRELLHECRGLVLPEAEGKALPIELLVGAELPVQLVGDPGRLRQVLLNVLSNAVKFTELGSVRMQVELAPGQGSVEFAEGDQLRLHFEVADTGVGIPDGDREKIFEQFSQVDTSSTRRFSGVGLGLTVARAHAEVMGGELCLVSSELNHGSVFAVELAFAVDTEPTADVALGEAGESQSEGQQGAEAARVLVVEDNKLNQRVAACFLERMGCHVTLANNGKEGLIAASGQDFDVVLMDCQMPVMDGLEATQEIRLLGDSHREVPIVALTAHALAEDEKRARDAGMDDYLTKPVNFEVLQRAVVRWRNGRLLHVG